MVAAPVEEQRKERKLSWCFLMAKLSSNEAVAIADSDSFGDGGRAAIVAKE